MQVPYFLWHSWSIAKRIRMKYNQWDFRLNALHGDRFTQLKLISLKDEGETNYRLGDNLNCNSKQGWGYKMSGKIHLFIE